MENKFNVQHLNNNLLLEGLKQNLSEERHSQALFLAHLAEGSTCKRIQTARSARKYPIIFSLIEKGEVRMTGVNLIAPFLKDDKEKPLK